MTFKLPTRYIHTGDICKGGMGDVLPCNDINLDRLIVIKFIQDIIDMPRLFDEIAALQKLRSNYVVEVYDIIVDRDTNNVGIVQEYLPGIDLDEFAKTKPTGENYLKLLYQIASGISDIHQQGIIHRDIKPNNMKFDREGRVKIFDFGLARKAGADAKTPGFRGTIGFAAPELYTNGTVYFTEAVDTYAFGATAWFLIENDLPKDLLHLPPKLNNIPSFSSLHSKIPLEIAEILDLSLSENPQNRPPMPIIRDAIARHLLYGRHIALLVNTSKREIYKIDRIGQNINIKAGNMGEVKIEYDGFIFKITSVNGDVYINNNIAHKDYILPGSCVITIGAPQLHSARNFITFDISHPEVVI